VGPLILLFGSFQISLLQEPEETLNVGSNFIFISNMLMNARLSGKKLFPESKV
jgi:hypothetical protein